MSSAKVCAAGGRTVSPVQHLAAGTLGERLGTDAAERFVAGPKLVAGVAAPVLPAQPLAVEQMGACRVRAAAGVGQLLDGLPV